MLNITIPTFFDSAGKEISDLYSTIRQICYFAASYNEIIKTGTKANRPATGVFYLATDEGQWYAYTRDTNVGDQGWVMFG